MNKLVILCFIILGIGFLTMLICLASYLGKWCSNQSTKIEDITMTIIIVLCTLSVLYLIYDSIKNPKPTFREVCEANGGIYIDNNGRAGDSCIYNRGEDNEYNN